jgi:cell division protein FtsL
VIASQAVRAAQTRRAAQPRPRHAARATRRLAGGTTWEMHTFLAVSAAIAFVFVLAMLYLAQTTTISTRGYEAQRLEQVRDELRRQNALLEVENARLDSPARIETEAARIGLVRVATIQVVQLEPTVTTAKR